MRFVQVGPDADIVLWVRLCGFSPPLPPALPRQAQEAAAALQHSKDQQDFLAHPLPSWDARLASSAQERLKGNALFAAQQWEDAIKAYGRGMVHLFLSKQEAQFAPIHESSMMRIHAAKAVLFLNRSAAHKAVQRWDNAEWDTNESLKHALQAHGLLSTHPTTLQPEDIPKVCLKGLFRRGQCRLLRAQHTLDRRPCFRVRACEQGAQLAIADVEASQMARAVIVQLAAAEQGSLHVVPPAAGHDRVHVASRVKAPPPVSTAAAQCTLQARQLLQACLERHQQDKSNAMRLYGGSLLRPHKPAGAATPTQAAAEGAGADDEVPELGD